MTRFDKKKCFILVIYTFGMRKVGRLSWSINAEILDSSGWLDESENNEPSLLERLCSLIIFLCSFLSVDVDEERLSWLLTSVELAHDVVIVSRGVNIDCFYLGNNEKTSLPPPKELIIIGFDGWGGGGIRGGGAYCDWRFTL